MFVLSPLAGKRGLVDSHNHYLQQIVSQGERGTQLRPVDSNNHYLQQTIIVKEKEELNNDQLTVTTIIYSK